MISNLLLDKHQRQRSRSSDWSVSCLCTQPHQSSDTKDTNAFEGSAGVLQVSKQEEMFWSCCDLLSEDVINTPLNIQRRSLFPLSRTLKLNCFIHKCWLFIQSRLHSGSVCCSGQMGAFILKCDETESSFNNSSGLGNDSWAFHLLPVYLSIWRSSCPVHRLLWGRTEPTGN